MQENDTPELQKRILFCFRIMSHCFNDPAKAEENFQILDQLKDANIWKSLTTLLDPDTSCLQACSCRDDFLKILGEKHQLSDFLSMVSLKCSYLLFNKEHVKEILLEADLQKSAGHAQFTLACMNILVILASFSPLLLSGIEEDLVHLLKDDNEVIKEGVLHVLAKAGGTIREQLGISSSSLDLILERICLEGSRRQAKYAVHALAAITKDDGLMSLSVLYKRLVDMLEEKTHLPAVLQSLGCIAQTAMSVFETREDEIEGFIKRNILECSNKADDGQKECWDDRSERCSLKIFGIKTLVKSYLPVKDAHLRHGIDGLLEILKNILLFGEISKDIESSPVAKAHIRLAALKAVLRLSKHWDHKIPINLFYLTLRISEISFPQAKKQFLNKVHQYLKEWLLDPKYTCHQGKAQQLSLQWDTNSMMNYPEYILPYLVHALAHHSSFPNVDDCRDVKAFEPAYRQLHLFLSMLMHGDEDCKPEVSIDKGKESISAIISIFQCIKCSADTVDPAKSKNSHAICDLGLSIIKRLAHKEDDLQESIVSVSLPPVLYKLRDKKGEEGNDPLVSEGQTWLADESILTHFESLKLEIHPEVDDDVLKDSETDGNGVPLGKMIKAYGTKNEDDVDILKMVREINLDNLGISSKFESSNGHENGHEDVPKKMKIDQKQQKRKKSLASETTNVPIPNAGDLLLRGSKWTSIHNLPEEERSSFESPERDEELHGGSEDKMSLQENVVEPAESHLSVTCFPKNMNSLSKHKSKSSDKDHTDEAYKVGEIDDYECTSKEGGSETMDLIDCRIKVWWPMDKKFYEGVVKSYDAQKKKHVVLYDDGDVEVLCLDKRRWELIDNGHKPMKKSKPSKGSPHKELNSPSKIRGKRTPRKNLKHVQKGASKSKTTSELLEADSRGSPGISNPKHAEMHKHDDMNSGGEHIETTEKSLTDGEESDNDQKSASEGKLAEDAKNAPSDIEKSEQEEPNSEEKTIKPLWIMGEPNGQLKVTVVRGKKLVVRDFKSSDPYVIVKLGNQTAKTRVINSCLNPVWNEELSFSLTEPVEILNLQVFDKDRFKADDKMGHAHLDLHPLISAARLRQILGVSLGETTLRRVIPTPTIAWLWTAQLIA
ncbi:Protein C2-DOMAIN ABA-RELATED 11 [Camellia lanceoleosa]|uniref:Protein C2-DOMAIN ABA-RELATED 11 n=1 Tax=Camellia lanceoleosa TaxID=1840588 RepID=A0ACC0GN00_9ERIC|nr:Protein C2-DOMAIN ABA-RELATED 11 [Camellia lanceoleosa]